MRNSNELEIRNKIHIVLLVVCVTIIVVLLVSCNKPEDDASGNQDTATANTMTTTDTNAIATDINVDDQTLEMIDIDTPYGTLNYPAKWSDNIRYEANDENGVYTETFYCCMKEQELELFNIYFGDPDKGSLIGYVNKDGKPVAFTVDTTDFIPDDSWAEEEKLIFNAMLDGINYVIESVVESENYLG